MRNIKYVRTICKVVAKCIGRQYKYFTWRSRRKKDRSKKLLFLLKLVLYVLLIDFRQQMSGCLGYYITTLGFVSNRATLKFLDTSSRSSVLCFNCFLSHYNKIYFFLRISCSDFFGADFWQTGLNFARFCMYLYMGYRRRFGMYFPLK